MQTTPFSQVKFDTLLRRPTTCTRLPHVRAAGSLIFLTRGRYYPSTNGHAHATPTTHTLVLTNDRARVAFRVGCGWLLQQVKFGRYLT